MAHNRFSNALARAPRTLAPILAALALAAAAAPARGQAEVHLADDALLSPSSPPPAGSRPVLFVHGHNSASATDADFNYRKNWHDAPAGATSFQQALAHPDNAWLGIEPYYIRFQEQRRSIVEDAREIADAVERILSRHDPTHVPFAPSPTTQVRLAIVAFSKGTISSRLYLKSLHEQQYDLPPPRPGFNPVSELVALSPPNHGLRSVFVAPDNLAHQQLSNGYGQSCAQLLLGSAESLDFIELLNGHPIEDSEPDPSDPAWTLGSYPQEAPGSRPDGAPVSAGTLFVALYADGERDLVGGSEPSSDCQGRELARNLAPDAVNIEVPEIEPGGSEIAVHQATPHAPEVVCLALYTAVHRRAPPVGFRCQLTTGGVPRVPPRAALVAVLDVSGSMLSPACPTCEPKLDVLRQAAELFVQDWSLLAGPGDRIGAVTFGSDVEVFAPAGEGLVELTAANGSALISHLQGLATEPLQRTALGGGLQRALELLSDPIAAAIPERHVVVFTDGMQNVDPALLRRDGAPPPGAFHYEIANRGGWPASSVVPEQPPLRLDGSLGVAVHTLGVGAWPPFQELLAEVAAGTGGNAYLTLAPDADLRQHFVEVVIAALQGGSPQLVDYRARAMGEGEVAEDFELERGARRLVLQLSWPRGLRFDLRVEKDGADVTRLSRAVEGDFYSILSFDLPAGPLGSEGTWTMRIRGPPGGRYEAAAIADHHALECAVGLTRAVVAVGEPIELVARASLDGRPLAGDARVTAVVGAPRAAMANLLAEAGPAGAGDAKTEGATAAQARLELLVQEPRWRERLASEPHVVALHPRSDGTWSGAFAGTTVPGPHRIDWRIEAGHPELGALARAGTLTALVRFGQAEPRASELAARELEGRGALRRVELSLRPRDRHGNLLGPGWGERIQVAVEPGTLASAPADDGEERGRYTAVLEVPAGADPKVEVRVMGEALFDGDLSTLAALRQRELWPIALLALLIAVVLIAVWVRRGGP